jgi:hypothetical protein
VPKKLDLPYRLQGLACTSAAELSHAGTEAVLSATGKCTHTYAHTQSQSHTHTHTHPHISTHTHTPERHSDHPLAALLLAAARFGVAVPDPSAVVVSHSVASLYLVAGPRPGHCQEHPPPVAELLQLGRFWCACYFPCQCLWQQVRNLERVGMPGRVREQAAAWNMKIQESGEVWGGSVVLRNKVGSFCFRRPCFRRNWILECN